MPRAVSLTVLGVRLPDRVLVLAVDVLISVALGTVESPPRLGMREQLFWSAVFLEGSKPSKDCRIMNGSLGGFEHLRLR